MTTRNTYEDNSIVEQMLADQLADDQISRIQMMNKRDHFNTQLVDVIPGTPTYNSITSLIQKYD